MYRQLLLKEPGVVCGLPALEAVFRSLDPTVSVAALAHDGDRFEQPTALARLAGRARAILTGERTALNLLGRLSGIATLTRRFVDAVEGTGATILDTRKTTPGLRALEKYAVRCGGGATTASASTTRSSSRTTTCALAGGIGRRVALLRAAGTACRSRSRPRRWTTCARRSPPASERILLDNMPPAADARSRRARSRAARRSKPPAASRSRPCAHIAETGVDFISVGALTHSARSLDVSLELE